MKIVFLFAIALVPGIGLSLVAQQTTAGAGQSVAASAQARPETASPKISKAAYDYLRPVNCELAGKLDSKSAKVGDGVVAKTTESLRLADGSVIPKGTKLIGHITNVQAHTSDQADSYLSIAFDHAEWKGGRAISILSVIQAVTPPVNAFASAQNEDILASSMAGAGSPGMIGARSGSGMVGGTVNAGSTTANPGSGVGASAANLGSNAGGALRNSGQTTSGIGGNATGAVASIGVSAATSASMGVHATGVPGVMLTGDPSGATAGTLSASKRNVHLDAGSQLTIAISATGSQ